MGEPYPDAWCCGEPVGSSVCLPLLAGHDFSATKNYKKTAQWQVMIFPVGFATIFAVLMGNFINHGLYHSLIDAATSTHSKGIRALEGASIGTYLSNAALVSKSDASFFSQLIIIFHVMNFFPQLWRAVRV